MQRKTVNDLFDDAQSAEQSLLAVLSRPRSTLDDLQEYADTLERALRTVNGLLAQARMAAATESLPPDLAGAAALTAAIQQADQSLLDERDRIRTLRGDWAALEQAAIRYAAAIHAAREHCPDLLAEQRPRGATH